MTIHQETPDRIGQQVTVDFDGRGLAEVIGQQNGMIGARYLDDPDRTSRNVRVGEVEWHTPADLRAA